LTGRKRLYNLLLVNILQVNIEIREIRREDAASYRGALDSVCRERRFLAGVAAPSLKMTRAFIEGNISKGNPHFVALVDGRVVGWCDLVAGDPKQGTAHVARLGMGVEKAYRRQGIGRLVMEAAIAKAGRTGIEKVELGVYSSNQAAISLYQKAGFKVEGRRLRARLLDNICDDVLIMGLFLADRPVGPGS
jgi:ribosomal protein S18 acetylase RimI-like enzyme